MKKGKNEKESKNETVNVGVIAWKGGVGKTFIAAHLIWGLAYYCYKRVVGVDLDNQGDLMKWMTGYKWRGETEYSVDDAILLLWRPSSEVEIPDGFDYAVFDGRPQLEVSADVLNMLDVVLIPIVGRLSQENARNLIELQEQMSPNTKVFLIANMIEARLYITREEKELSEKIGAPIFEVGIPKTVRVRESEMLGIPVWEVKYANRGMVPAVLKSLAFFIDKGKWREK